MCYLFSHEKHKSHVSQKRFMLIVGDNYCILKNSILYDCPYNIREIFYKGENKYIAFKNRAEFNNWNDFHKLIFEILKKRSLRGCKKKRTSSKRIRNSRSRTFLLYEYLNALNCFSFLIFFFCFFFLSFRVYI